MKFLLEWASHKQMYLSSVGIGGVVATIINFISRNTPEEMFGISIGIWTACLMINLVDIHTGIKADTVRKKEIGEKFKFESRKGWRAIEKVFVFTMVIYFLHQAELELNMKKMPEFLATGILYIKLAMFFYVVLIELQSIGENNEVRFGKKGKMFVQLDNIINVVNEGILNQIGSMFKKKSE